MKWIRYFIQSAGAILLAAALSRFLIATSNAQVLVLPDPMLGIPLRYAVMIVGVLELTVALICLFGKQAGLQVGWLAWLITDYFVFGIGLFALGIHPQATCIGGLTDQFHLSRGIIGLITRFIPIYLLLGSYASVIGFWMAGRAALPRSRPEPKAFKISCPGCGGHIKFDRQNLGQKIPCPHCQIAITLRKPDDLKMSCFFCQEHIEFPAYAIGEKLQCPHCKMDITLREPA